MLDPRLREAVSPGRCATEERPLALKRRQLMCTAACVAVLLAADLRSATTRSAPGKAGTDQAGGASRRRHAEIIASARSDRSPRPHVGPDGPFHPSDFAIVGVYDVDWLVRPEFQRLLDNMAASPGAFRSVRFFGSLSSGTTEYTVDRNPPAGAAGTVWPATDAPMNFSRTFSALEALTSRGLIPFVVLSFFPPAVSSSGIVPPNSFGAWKRLVRGFFDQLVADPRFGPSAIRNWWFEVWNEPNMDGFWGGDFARYLELYRATSEAVIEAGHDVRLGGPAIAYLPTEAGSRAGARLMEAFLRFLDDEPELKCDFLSLHRKGTWGSGEPDLDSLILAAEHTANTALAINAVRFRGMPIINNEADMKVGFDTPYEPRMDERFPSWLSAVSIAYDALSSRYAGAGFRFLAACDDANLQLVRGPFDGRRSIVTRASEDARDLFKVPIYNFYETLRLLGDRHGVVRGMETAGGSDLFHAITVADSHIGVLLTVHPRSPDSKPHAWRLDYKIVDVPWPRVNIARFQIDRTHSNAYGAAGGMTAMPYPEPAKADRIRHAQELTTSGPIRRDVALAASELHDIIDLDPFTTVCIWMTPVVSEAPADPTWLEGTRENERIILRWQPNFEPFFYSYEVHRMVGGEPTQLLSPVPLRAAMWIDSAPAFPAAYGVRAVSASGYTSALVETAV
jgi:hypothetical protein